jgi:hypothetical protein
VPQLIATLEHQSSEQPRSRIFLLSVVDPALRYEVLSYNGKKKRARLQGKEGEFDMGQFTSERLAQLGYRLVREEDLPKLELEPAPKPACGVDGRKCNGLCPPHLWITCPMKGGRFTLH